MPLQRVRVALKAANTLFESAALVAFEDSPSSKSSSPPAALGNEMIVEHLLLFLFVIDSNS